MFNQKTQHEKQLGQQVEQIKLLHETLSKNIETLKTKKNTFLTNVLCPDLEAYFQTFEKTSK